jgi:transcriptional regulator with XRE-family HTH domain
MAKKLKALRAARGWSQAELAERSGVSKVHIARIETEKREPTLSVIEKLAKAFKLPAAELLKWAMNTMEEEESWTLTPRRAALLERINQARKEVSMKPRTIVAVAALAMVLGAAPVASEQTLLGYGSRPCSEYTTARAGARTGNQKAQLAELSFANWAAGYLQAFHQCMVSQGRKEGILTGTTNVMERVTTALDQYCQSKPADSFAVATTVAGASLAGVKPKK